MQSAGPSMTYQFNVLLAITLVDLRQILWLLKTKLFPWHHPICLIAQLTSTGSDNELEDSFSDDLFTICQTATQVFACKPKQKKKCPDDGLCFNKTKQKQVSRVTAAFRLHLRTGSSSRSTCSASDTAFVFPPVSSNQKRLLTGFDPVQTPLVPRLCGPAAASAKHNAELRCSHAKCTCVQTFSSTHECCKIINHWYMIVDFFLGLHGWRSKSRPAWISARAKLHFGWNPKAQ